MISSKILKRDALEYKLKVPHIIKYMGSKSSLLHFLVESINEIYEGEDVCDLFAGTSVLSGSIGHGVNMHVNDIQSYSAVLAKTYLGNYEWEEYPNITDDIVNLAQVRVNRVYKMYPELNYQYSTGMDLKKFNEIEQKQQDLIFREFKNIDYHLFTKYYSGTYWSFEQCIWIDALRGAAESYIESPFYNPILSSLMFAMAYNAQSTGHYAQYRNANNLTSMNDIIFYRKKEIIPFFKKKFKELIESTGKNDFEHSITSLDYRDCLDNLPNGTMVYADPPYAFVHYSRFYHALETLIRYDYPDVAHKGRYRKDRHQSPFCKKTEVVGAFRALFEKIKLKNSKLVLSYSNTGMISLEKILEIADKTLGKDYSVVSKALDYTHSTMGRSEDKSRNVKELLIIAKPIK